MDLMGIVARAAAPEPWSEGEKIPWDDPAFSRRMLQEHLSQAHDAASRRAWKIDRHVAWIHGLLRERPGRVLDLGCGPGLYILRLSRLGHECTGIDFAPAAVEHGRRQAAAAGLPCTFVQGDLRCTDFGGGHDLAMLVFGELNVFRPCEARDILCRACAALRPGGLLLLEVHTLDAVAETSGRRTWYSAPAGLFSESPHLCLEECQYDAQRRVSTSRYYVVDARTARVERHASSMQGYSEGEYRQLLAGCGLAGVELRPSLGGPQAEAEDGLVVVLGRRAGEGAGSA